MIEEGGFEKSLQWKSQGWGFFVCFLFTCFVSSCEGDNNYSKIRLRNFQNYAQSSAIILQSGRGCHHNRVKSNEWGVVFVELFESLCESMTT